MIVEYANYLASRGCDVVLEASQVKTVLKLQVPIQYISRTSNKVMTILKAISVKRKCDVIIADIIVLVAFLSLRNRKRIIYFAQDYDESYYKNPLIKLFIRAMYFYALSILRIPVIAVSDELGQLLRSTFKANVTVVNNGVDSEIFYREENDMLLALKGKSKIVLVFARSDYRKGFDIAIKVLQQYREQIEKGSLAVWAVGEHLPVPFPVNYFGFVGQEYLRKILSCSDVLLYPSRHEGLPLFVLEALFCSCPVVTTKAVKILTDGKDGVVCDIDNIACLKKAVTSLIEEEQFHQNVVQEGLRTAQKYQLRESKREFYRTLLALYNQRSGHLSSNFLKS